MSARDGAFSITDKYGNPIPANNAAGAARRRPAAGGFWRSIPSFGQEVRALAVLFAIVGLVWLAVRA